ncbi:MULTISPECIES: sensor domain-containing diguanylate cyclase [Stenotrophomonas]|uniref:diguanylate cyclase n=1 Tax=Stenotrophomonas lactitubi TaxID=2045214 RepID=A0AAW4GGI3_9GAMM|nr:MULTISPECIES: sensor domain-containing diguanylate cyclase [Stenotrophomonas]MBM9913021.1 GGDEF domain-containing protein [Stenotrophomonas lactitubi]MBM9922341.1 GGDEF domain-containing protein [Stenotrophomonas lactitubi]MBM9937451.1 GGDEF domain-containing protein [Stenotrophomonas lactitubi]NYT98186.1 sensor domain-containing diguanylate cyclase [Stenotrophomonas sp. SbOxS2]
MRTLSPRLNLGKLILALALLSAVIALANTLLASYRVQRDQLVGNTLEANRVYATKLAETTQNFLLAAQQQLAYAATRLGNSDMDPAQAQDEASRLQLQSSSFNSSLVVASDGRVIATSPQSLQLQGEILRSAGSKAALDRREPMISDPYQSATGKLLISISHPVFDRSGQYRGYVSGTLYLRQRSALNTLLGTHYYRDGSYLYVVDRHGRLIYHNNAKEVGTYALNNPAVKEVMRGQRGAQQVLNNHKVAMLAGYAPVAATGWGIVAQRPTEATLQPLSRLMSAVIWNAIPLGVLSLLITWWFARRISLPLWQLARNVQDGEDTGNAISHVNGIRAWYFEVAQLKQAVLYSFSALQDRIGTLNRASRTDPLTGLLNRRGLQQALDALQAQGLPFAILTLDIDRFKSINDSHGHDVGDAAIVHIAEQMRRHSRETDVLCRAGGEEFLVLLPGVGIEAARQTGERLRQAIADEPFAPVGTITVSLGVAHFPSFHTDPEQALRLADKALYLAKEQGRNRVVVYPHAD